MIVMMSSQYEYGTRTSMSTVYFCLQLRVVARAQLLYLLSSETRRVIYWLHNLRVHPNNMLRIIMMENNVFVIYTIYLLGDNNGFGAHQ